MSLLLTKDKEIEIEIPPDSKYKLIQIIDRGSLNWPSNFVIEAIVTLWKIFSSIETVAALARHHCVCPGNFGGCDNIINSLPDVI